MDRQSDSRPKRRLIDTGVKARFVGALRRGVSREAAAAEAGFPLQSLYAARARDPLFRSAWEWAMDLACIDERGGRLSRRGEDGEIVRIAPQNGRLLQRRRMRWLKFTARRQQIYLDHFAGTADCEAAAAAAGVSSATVRAHARKHPEFAAAESDALRFAYAALEAEAVRQRLEAQRRLAQDLEPAGEIAREFARGDVAAEFERVMKLLARYDRRDGRVAARERAPLPGQAWTFEAAIAALDKALDSLAIRRHLLPGPADADRS